MVPGEERHREEVEGHAVCDAAGRCRRVGEYSPQVPQRARTEVVAQGRVRTVTCTDGRRWTCCRQIACKRSAVRARTAPLVRSIIRAVRTASTAGKYSNGGRVGRRMCVRIGRISPIDVAGTTPDSRSWTEAGQPVTWANPRLIGPVILATWPPPSPLEGPFLPATVAAFASGPGHAGRPGRCDSLPGTAPAGQDGASQTAGPPRGLSALRR